MANKLYKVKFLIKIEVNGVKKILHEEVTVPAKDAIEASCSLYRKSAIEIHGVDSVKEVINNESSN